MGPLTQTTHSAVMDNVRQGVRNGALNGAKAGAVFLAGVAVSGIVFAVLEKGNRTLGCEPRWAMFEGDCQLEQFQHSEYCTNPPLFDSSAAFTVFVMGATTLCGGVIGAVVSVAKSCFQKRHIVRV